MESCIGLAVVLAPTFALMTWVTWTKEDEEERRVQRNSQNLRKYLANRRTLWDVLESRRRKDVESHFFSKAA